MRVLRRCSRGLLSRRRCRSCAWAVEPFVVRDIRVEGVQRTEAGTIFSYLPIKVGDRVDDEKDLRRGQGAVRDRLLSRRAPRGAGRRADRHRAGAADDQLDHVRRQQGIRHRHAQEGAEGHRHRRGAHLRPLGARARRAGTEAPVHHARQVRGQRADDGHAAGAQPRRDQLHDRGRRFGEDRAHQHRRRQGVHREAAAVAR